MLSLLNFPYPYHFFSTLLPPLPLFFSLLPSLSFFLSRSLSLEMHYNGPGWPNPDHGAYLFPLLISSLLKRWREGGREREERNYPLLNFYISFKFLPSFLFFLFISLSPLFFFPPFPVLLSGANTGYEGAEPSLQSKRERGRRERERAVKRKEENN